eukprot:CAMPEP_0181209140 /NCGR_PEP_ID=MMETSP1096-20121128/22502_1 /TAXON_ID=156174 ORGANISM="Chrysochromulina ericina, Strain CCMP281" /NCGR_SAMPLE_ID=MMETSP1096 /ASSEMBLY_ACC=CAM_ASM_000453 /LENGTH=63 /DNA_ID=CAMNT_0023300271 /DNA_START=640 /DNA_END=832 /DNA_ORIENTATION=+
MSIRSLMLASSQLAKTRLVDSINQVSAQDERLGVVAVAAGVGPSTGQEQSLLSLAPRTAHRTG